VGVGTGIGISLLLGWIAPFIAASFKSDFNLATRITSFSIFLAFSVAAATGLIFGLYPAFQAAKKDPIVALRHD
jgi:putative ABC transport system permease protein